MDMIRECISFNFELRDMLLSLQIGSSFGRASVVYAILERTSMKETISQTDLYLVNLSSKTYVFEDKLTTYFFLCFGF